MWASERLRTQYLIHFILYYFLQIQNFAKLYRCPPTAVSDGVSTYRQMKLLSGSYRRFKWRHGLYEFQTKIVTSFLNLDGDKLYTKLVAFNEIYNFVVQFFHLKSSLGSNNRHKYFFVTSYFKKLIYFI
jgi:hypothetical protein